MKIVPNSFQGWADNRPYSPYTNADLIELARAAGGMIGVKRVDRETGELVEDIITDQMPECELF